MVSLSDIPVLGKAVDMISEAMVKAAYRGLCYMFCYKNLVNNFNSEFDKFKVEEGRVSTKVVEERDNGKIIEDHVSNWQKEVEEIQQDSKEFLERYEKRASWKCIKCVPIPNPFNRFRIGRDAEKKADKLAALTQSGKELLDNPIARLPPVENLPKTDGEFQNFQSRKDAYEKIWKSLVSEGGPQILGIYGLPGVGKTRIADQIWKETKEKGIFKKVTKTVVSSEKDLDVKRLQNELAGDLNCSLESQDDIKRRASQLKQSIINGDKVLIILDDVWREIPLHDIGIPIGHDDTTSSKGSCKILLTSRERKVCLDNKCIDPVEITALTSAEAWDMFKDSVGTHKIESLQDEFLANQVCNKCGGLPLLIRAVGKALRNMSGNVWKDALEQLEKYRIERIPGIDQRVYACLKLSFDNLVDDDAKACLLLCSLYPEDAYISIDMLIELGTGSKLLEGGRSRVLSMVDILKSSSLVLDTSSNQYFKLHDIIRDVTRSIAVRDYAFSFARCDSRLPANYGSTQLLCLEVKESDDMMNQDIHLIKNDILHTLWIRSADHRHEIQVPEVASMFVNLRCLILRDMRWEPVLQLGELRTLVLEYCNIRKTDFSFISEKLETLCIWRCDLPEPMNIINLKHLRKLEIRDRYDGMAEVLLVADTISSLSSLEELHIPGGYRYHKAEEHNDDEVNYNNSISQQLAEFTNLRRLKSLKMSFRKVSQDDISVPKVISNLSEFHISVGADPEKLLSESASYPSLTRKSIHLCGKRFEAATFQSLIERAQVVILTSTNVNVSSAFNTNNAAAAAAAFADLEFLAIDGSDTMEHLAKISHHHRHQIHPRTSFFKLTRLRVGNCSAMKYLFCNSVAKCLVQLEELLVNDCPVMEAIVMNEGRSNSDGQEEEEDMIIINFPKLKSLRLSSMPKLKGFNIEKKKKKDIMQHTASTISLSDNSVIIPAFTLFPQEIAFPALEELWLSSLSVSDIWGKHYFNDNASSFSKLKKLTVVSCTKMETVIPLAMSHKLQNLEYLDIKDCSLVISEVGTYDSNRAAVCPLVALTKMHLQKLPCLRNTGLNSILDQYSQAITNLYPNLKELEIQECNSLSNVFLTSIARNLMMHLEELKVDNCEMMTEIIGAAAGEHKISTAGIVFPKLRTLRLVKLKNLTSFRRNQSGEANNICKDVLFPNLETCKIMCCDKINFKDTEFWRDGVPCQLMSLDIRFDEEMQLIPCTWDLRNLEYLTLANCWWHEQHIIPSFSRLSELQVTKSGRSTLFPFFVISSLQQLQKLQISDCALLEDIVTMGNTEASSMDNKKIIEFIQLKRVVLKDLPKLQCFMYGADYECHMPALEDVIIANCGFSTLFPFSVISSLQQLREIYIRRCALLEGIVEEDVRKRGNIEASSSRDKKKIYISDCALLEGIVTRGNAEASSMDNKKIIKLIHLSRVVLEDLPNLRSFMSGADYECHMPDLAYVFINNCGFSTLFTCSTNLQQLYYLAVSNCRLLEHIVGDVRDDDDDDISKTDDKIIITLSHLWGISLENLPDLKSFGRTSSYDFDMPGLRIFTLLQCPQVENFSSLKTSTGTSIIVRSDWHSNGVDVRDLNDYIKENRKRDDSNLISDEGAAAGETDDS